MPGSRDESRIDDLTATGLVALRAELSLEHLEELLNHLRLAEPLPEEGHWGGIWNAVHHPKSDKLVKGKPIIHLEFKLLLAEVEKLLENEHLEKEQRLNPLAPCVALAIMRLSLIKQWAQRFPWDRVSREPANLLPILELCHSLIFVPEAFLTHSWPKMCLSDDKQDHAKKVSS